MTSSTINSARASSVTFTDDEITVLLTDGRSLSIPIVWFPRLAKATASERADYELLGSGEGIHWPQIDEDISVSGLLAGRPSVEFGRQYGRN